MRDTGGSNIWKKYRALFHSGISQRISYDMSPKVFFPSSFLTDAPMTGWKRPPGRILGEHRQGTALWQDVQRCRHQVHPRFVPFPVIGVRMPKTYLVLYAEINNCSHEHAIPLSSHGYLPCARIPEEYPRTFANDNKKDRVELFQNYRGFKISWQWSLSN